ncbi:MAG: nitroreductase family protein [Candidatus Hodarchaeales archaeon]|jgi:nitroreductase
MDFFETIIKNKRYNSFQSEESLDQDQLKQLLACAQLAPSLSESQNFAFIIITDSSLKSVISEKITNNDTNIINAAVIFAVVVVQDATDDKNIIDAIIASNQLMLAATAMGLGTNLIVDFDESVDEILGLNPDLSIIGLIPVGTTTDKGYQGLKRSISDLAFHNSINSHFEFS